MQDEGSHIGNHAIWVTSHQLLLCGVLRCGEWAAITAADDRRPPIAPSFSPFLSPTSQRNSQPAWKTRTDAGSCQPKKSTNSELCSRVCVSTDDSIDADALKISARAAEGGLRGSSAAAEDFWQSPEATAPRLGRFPPALLHRHVKKTSLVACQTPTLQTCCVSFANRTRSPSPVDLTGAEGAANVGITSCCSIKR